MDLRLAQNLLYCSCVKTKSRTVIHTLFPHAADPAYQKLAELEERVGRVKPRRGTAPLKQQLQCAIVRISEYLVDYSNDEDQTGRESWTERAVADCREAAILVEMLFRFGAFRRETATQLRESIDDVAEILSARVAALRGTPSPTPPRPPRKRAKPTRRRMLDG